MQKSLPGELDVMGASLLNTSRIGIGFNRDVAWTHRVSTALRFTVYELELDPEDPMRYRYDDDYREIEPRSVELEVASEGETQTRSASVYFTEIYAQGGWVDLPFTEQEILADGVIKSVRIGHNL